MTQPLPVILLTDENEKVKQALEGKVEYLSWEEADQRPDEVVGMLIYGHPTINGEVMDRYPNLRMISNCGVGVDHIEVADAVERNIRVGNTPGVLSEATADMAFTLLLAAGRRLIEGDHYARSAEFTKFDSSYMLGTEVSGSTLGIIGLGRIGLEVARRGLGFNMRVLYHNRKPKRIEDPAIEASYVSKDQLLRRSDYVVIVVPLNEETRDLISYEEFEKMKPTAVLVNVARGGVVNTDAITKALQTRQIYAAGLDVTEPEPLPRDHPLLKQQNLTIAPHLGSATIQTRQKMLNLSVSNLLNGVRGDEIVTSVM